jgi:hypothetical protein
MIGADEVLVEFRDKLFQGCSEAQRLSKCLSERKLSRMSLL